MTSLTKSYWLYLMIPYLYTNLYSHQPVNKIYFFPQHIETTYTISLLTFFYFGLFCFNYRFRSLLCCNSYLFVQFSSKSLVVSTHLLLDLIFPTCLLRIKKVLVILFISCRLNHTLTLFDYKVIYSIQNQLCSYAYNRNIFS